MHRGRSLILEAIAFVPKGEEALVRGIKGWALTQPRMKLRIFELPSPDLRKSMEYLEELYGGEVTLPLRAFKVSKLPSVLLRDESGWREVDMDEVLRPAPRPRMADEGRKPTELLMEERAGKEVIVEGERCMRCMYYSERTSSCFRLAIIIKDPTNPPCKSV